MASRLTLQTELERILGSSNVYFQPPESVKMNYPAIVYGRSSGDTQFANNRPYIFVQSYDITVIDKNPDSEIAENIVKHFPMSRYDRNFKSDNLNHDVVHTYY